MLSDGQLITALTGLFSLSTTAKKAGVRLERTPRTIDDENMDMNHEFKVLLKGVDTGYYCQVGMGELTLDFFDGDGSTEIYRLDKSQKLATPMLDFVARVINTVKKVEA